MNFIKPKFTVPITSRNYKNIQYNLQIIIKNKEPRFPNN